ncbi:hypothetical protein SY27_13650 [Flavobacterium sp. 316]|uniref:hypothetical protein n=1 Tax=Flavobacterium sp. 316 TaxID=1603293 RepID=UPI0005E23FDB|nr:hypothetical protein [Flavobacterium sp. 316]KIX20188.1 hypothetical protein SY27_13650 [Flavobacterium sp. 316]
MKKLKKYLLHTFFIFIFLVCFLYKGYGQQAMGRIYDQMRAQSFLLYDNGLIIQDGNPMNRGFVQRDPSGFMYLMVPAANPMINAYFIAWDRRFIEIDRYRGANVIGYYDGFIPNNPFANVYQKPNYKQNYGIETSQGNFIQIPDEVVNKDRPYGDIMITNEMKAQECYKNAYSTSTGLDREKFTMCMIQNMAGKKELDILNCIRNSKTPEERALCLFEKLGGQKEKEIAQKIYDCYAAYGNDWSRYPLCMSIGISDPEISKILACMEQQSKSGDVTFMGTALCYGLQNFDLNAETQIIIECALASGGEPYTFAGCAGGQLLTRELDKCFTYGIGGERGCFGKNNDIIKGLKAIGDALNIKFGPNNDITKLWNNTVNDITTGPGYNHEAVKTIRNISNEIGRTSDNLGKTIEKALPKIKIKW